jgi:hypothetical protein
MINAALGKKDVGLSSGTQIVWRAAVKVVVPVVLSGASQPRASQDCDHVGTCARTGAFKSSFNGDRPTAIAASAHERWPRHKGTRVPLEHIMKVGGWYSKGRSVQYRSSILRCDDDRDT